MAANPGAKTEEPTPFLILLTGPVLNFLAAQEQKRIENGGTEERRMSFWPFAVAGTALFGLGVAGGNAFMSGSVSQGMEAAATEAAEAEQQQKPGRRRAGAVPQKQRATATSVRVEEAISEGNRRSAVRAASASLALGTLLACTGAVVAVKCTQWYLGVKDAHEFAEYMRSRLPGRARAVTDAVNLDAKKSGLADWFRTKMGVGKFVETKEGERRVKELQAIKEKGMLTEREFEEEKRRILDQGLSASTT